jgi:hypothetical protein
VGRAFAAGHDRGYDIGHGAQSIAGNPHIAQPRRQMELLDERGRPFGAGSRRRHRIAGVERHAKPAGDRVESGRRHRGHEAHGVGQDDRGREAVGHVPPGSDLVAEHVRQTEPGVGHSEHSKPGGHLALATVPQRAVRLFE